MKTLITVAALWMMSIHPIISQSNFYNFSIYGGFSPAQTPYQAGLILNREDPLNEFIFNLDEIEKSFVFGFKKNFRFSYPFYGTLGLEYTKLINSYSMHFTHSIDPGIADYKLTTTSHSLNLPAGVGVRMGKIDVTSGLMLQYDVKTTLEEEFHMGIEMAKPQVGLGWYTGVGLSIDRTRIGIQYQSSMKRVGHNMMYQGKSMELTNVPGYVRFTAGFSF